MQNLNSVNGRLETKEPKTETISELAHRHLMNEKHTTSDAELRNATLELTDNFADEDNNLSGVNDNTETSFGDDEGNTANDKSAPNPYAVLGA